MLVAILLLSLAVDGSPTANPFAATSSQPAAMATDVPTLQAEVARLRGQLAAMREENSTLRRQISRLTGGNGMPTARPTPRQAGKAAAAATPTPEPWDGTLKSPKDVASIIPASMWPDKDSPQIKWNVVIDALRQKILNIDMDFPLVDAVQKPNGIKIVISDLDVSVPNGNTLYLICSAPNEDAFMVPTEEAAKIARLKKGSPIRVKGEVKAIRFTPEANYFWIDLKNVTLKYD